MFGSSEAWAAEKPFEKEEEEEKGKKNRKKEDQEEVPPTKKERLDGSSTSVSLKIYFLFLVFREYSFCSLQLASSGGGVDGWVVNSKLLPLVVLVL